MGINQTEFKMESRRTFRWIGWLLLLHLGSLLLVAIVGVLTKSSLSSDRYLGFLAMLGSLPGVAAFLSYRGKMFLSYDLQVENRPFDGVVALKWALFAIGSSGVFSFLWMNVIENFVHLFGYSTQEAQKQLIFSFQWGMVFYLVIAAPIMEEIIFRGVILRSLEKYGNGFSVVVSAILFGFVHGNVVQTPMAILMGLILGVVTLKYSIRLAIYIHMFNNGVAVLTLYFAEQWGVVQLLFFFLVTGYFCFIFRKEGADWWRQLFFDKDLMRRFFTTFPVLLFLGFSLLLMTMGITKL